jgi:hypothetical protein
MLEGPRRFVFGVAGQMDFAILPDNPPRLVDEDGGVETSCPALLLG